MARIILSPRGSQLVLDECPTFPCIAAELYGKWSGLYKVHPNGTVERAQMDMAKVREIEETGDWVYGDHIFNPKHIRKVFDCPIDSRSWELIVGRFAIRHGAMERQFPEFQED
jgi:hypothetical protein